MYNAEITNEGERVLARKWQRNLAKVNETIHGYRIYFNYYGSKGTIKKVVDGVVGCDPTDKYNEEFGKQLAKTKAYEAYHHEVKKLMIAETYRPEWKKKQKMSFEAICLKDDDRLSFVLTGIQDKDRVLKEVNRKFDAGKDIKVTIEEI